MLKIAVPGRASLELTHLVMDFNGTLAVDGAPLPGVAAALAELSAQLELHLITADTFGTARDAMSDVALRVRILPPDEQDEAKRAYVEGLGPDRCAAIGNGRNDRLMLEAAALGIAVIQEEGADPRTLLAADVVCPGIITALQLFSRPKRLVASLRR